MKSKITSVLGKLGLVVGSLMLVLLVGEIGVRALGLAPSAQSAGTDSVANVVIFDAKLETRYQPSAHTKIQSQYGEFTIDYQFNELGLRDGAIPARSEDKSLRILALGNSFVEGWGVQTDESFLHVAEAKLSARRPVRIINGGASGYGAVQSYLLCKELLAKTQPDALVFFYLPTMLSADQKFLAKAELDRNQLAVGVNVDAIANAPTMKQPAGACKEHAGCCLLTKLSEYSGLARFVRMRLENRAAQDGIVAGDPFSDLLAAYRAPVEELTAMHGPTLRHMIGMSRLAHEAKIPFVVIQLPMPFEISSSEWARGRHIYGLSNEVHVPTEVRRLPEAAMQQEGIPLIAAHEFLAANVQRQPGQPGIYYAFDFHLNATGQRLLGAWLADQLSARLSMDQKLLEGPQPTTSRPTTAAWLRNQE